MALDNWGAGYFSVNRRGHLTVHTQPGQSPGIDIKAIVDTARGTRPIHASAAAVSADHLVAD